MPEFFQSGAGFDGVRIVTPEEAETCDVVICMPDIPGVPRGPAAAHFGQCSECHRAIYWADSAPKTVRKVCLDCGVRMAERDDDDD